MNRTMRAVLHYTAEDLKWVLVVSLILGLLGEGLGLAATLLGEPEDAGKMVVGTMLAISFLVSMILSIVYLANQFTMFLSFSATRRGLTAGILLHGLRISVLQTAIALVWGTADALVRRTLTGSSPLPWEWIPWGIWPLALLLPVWIGLLLGGLLQRFGAKGFWCAYAVFMIGTTSISQWADAGADFFRPVPWQTPAAIAVVVIVGLAALSLRWMQRAIVK